MDTGERERTGAAAERPGPDGIEDRESESSYRTRFDPGERTASEAVIGAVSTATGVDAMELPPIYDAVDPDALCNLVSPAAPRSGRFRGTVTFEYADTLVTVDGRGVVEVDPLGGVGQPTE